MLDKKSSITWKELGKGFKKLWASEDDLPGILPIYEAVKYFDIFLSQSYRSIK
jgi:hypothetical protein